jgi:uncharacterized protein (TIGR03437 family)
VGPGFLDAQVLDNSFLNGNYGFRQVLISTTALGAPIDARSIVGVVSFNGSGGFSFDGTRNIGTGGPSTFRGSGSYSVAPNGFVSMTNPLESSATLNLRLGSGMLLGSTTDSSGNIFDLFLAAPLPIGGVSAATINGAYVGASLEYPNGIFFNVKNAFFRFTANGQGTLGQVAVSGQTTQSGKRIMQQSIGPSSYNLGNDGRGTLIFPETAPLTPAAQLLLGDKQIFASANGQFLFGGSIQQGAHDLIIAFKAPASGATAANFSGLFYAAGLKTEQSRPSSFAGAVSALGNGRSVWSRRVRQPEGVSDLTAVNDYNVNADGTGAILTNRFAVSADGNLAIGVGTSFVDTDNYELNIAIKTRVLSGGAVFVNPVGVVNGASFAPTGTPIAPGQFLAIFGNGLGPAQAAVAAAPFPTSLSGVSVTIQGRAAPIYFVSSGQLSALVPFATSGTSAEIVVRNGSQESNRVTVPVARTSPGIYSQPQNGIGAGAILKSNFSLLTPANPGRRGDTVLIYLTGLGALNPPLADGAPASTTVLSFVTESVNVYIGGVRATVSFAGAAPGFAGLYQLNVMIPNTAPAGNAVPVAVETANSFHDMVDIAIAP